MDFARALARRLARTLASYADAEALESDAMLGLLLAARAFDPGRGAAFTTYAAKRICGAMLDGLRERQGCSRDALPPVIKSLSTPARDGDGREVTLGDLLQSDDEPVGAAFERSDEVERLLKRLDGASRRLVRQYYFGGHTLQAISQRQGTSTSRVWQRLNAARNRLRKIALSN